VVQKKTSKNGSATPLSGKKNGSSNLSRDTVDPSRKMEGKFYNALDHEIRRKLLKIVGKEGHSSFTHFKKSLKVSTGTLYHHLDVLKELISQNEARKYILTNLGKLAYNFLIKNYDSFESSNIQEQRLITERFKRLLMFIPVKTFEKIKEKPNLGWILSVSLLTVFYFLIVVGTVDSAFIFFLPYDNGLSFITIGEKMLLGLKFLVAVILGGFFSEVLCRFLFGKNENTKNFFSVYAIGLFPMLIYLILFDILYLINPVYPDSIISKILMIIFQVWAIWLISYILTIYKSIKLERSLLITFLIHYVAFNVLLFA
jgi:hypothetical protein